MKELRLARPGTDLAAAILNEDDQAADAYLGTLAAGGLRAIAVVPRHPMSVVAKMEGRAAS